MPSDFRRILLEALVLLLLGSLLGLSVNYRLVINLLEGKTVSQPPSGTSGSELLENFPVPVDLAEFRELRDEGVVVIDARIPELYREGHIPGARSLPFAEVDDRLPGFRLDTPQDATIVAYCSGYGCPDSFDLALRLLEEGFEDVRVFEGGFPEWKDAGLPVDEDGP